MKKIIISIFTAILCLAFGSCRDYINVDEYFYDQLSLDSAFSKKIYVEGWLANAFAHINDFVESEQDEYRWGSDDIINPDAKDRQNGNYNASSVSNSLLYKGYEAIRKASTFIDNVDRCPELTYSEIADMKSQARFLRGYAYWTIILRFGPMPLVPEHGLDVNLSYEELSLPRAPLDDMIDFIDQDLKLAALGLPLRRTVNNLGHPTKGAALTLRARVLLYAASPLMNGNTDLFNVKDNKGNQLIPQTYDEGKWAKAAMAAKEVIDLEQYSLNIINITDMTKSYERPPYNKLYSDKNYPDGWANVDPFASYKSVFDGSILGSKSSELIFTRTSKGRDLTNHWTMLSVPRTLSGNNKIAASQKQVDAYYMDNGQTIQEAQGTGYYQTIGFTTSGNPENEGGAPFVPANVSLMYTHREPRFYASIAFNGSIWECESANESKYRNQQIFYYKDENDGKLGFKEELPLSGVGIKKYYNKEDAFTQGGYKTDKTEQNMRYAEVLLIYAEALNELTSGEVHTIETYNGEQKSIQRNPEEMRMAMKQIRMRAGMPDFSDEMYNDPKEFRIKLKRERQLELFAENGMRHIDLRRWKDAMEEENQQFMGCNINITNDETKIQEFYIPTTVTSVPKVFLQKMYLGPIPTSELKRNINMTQNPEW